MRDARHRRPPGPAEDDGAAGIGAGAWAAGGGVMLLCCLGPLFLPALIAAAGGVGLASLFGRPEILLLAGGAAAGGLFIRRRAAARPRRARGANLESRSNA